MILQSVLLSLAQGALLRINILILASAIMPASMQAMDMDTADSNNRNNGASAAINKMNYNDVVTAIQKCAIDIVITACTCPCRTFYGIKDNCCPDQKES